MQAHLKGMNLKLEDCLILAWVFLIMEKNVEVVARQIINVPAILDIFVLLVLFTIFSSFLTFKTYFHVFVFVVLSY